MLALDQRIPLLLALTAVVAMLGLTSWQAYQFWQTESQRALPQMQAAGNSTDAPRQNVPEVQLANLTLFGTAADTGSAVEVDTENLPETNLRLSLRGVLAADGEFPGSALIEDDKGKTEAYLVGSELPGNAKLRTVFPNRVIIERAGKLENLYFPELDDRSGVSLASTSAEALDREIQQRQTPQPAQRASSSGTATPAGEQQRREEIRQRLEQLRQRLQNSN
ncbi:type II secretion system protein N [Marinobacter sp. LQ44]|uniref:type II secretion system protein N n=1 Tax=unclassified Marinobacter TaxID=83889 RepID=UPI000718FB83|nr:type II secretion system protein N [Marinobacter sp. LQ44]AMQ87541.1 general secretion pathway protein GspC [Marinobacter sp. LQ44]